MGAVRRVVQISRSVVVYVCDECGAEQKKQLNKCDMCERELCGKCTKEYHWCDRYGDEDREGWLPEFNFEVRTCDRCWRLGAPMRKTIQDARNALEGVLVQMRDAWESACETTEGVRGDSASK